MELFIKFTPILLILPMYIMYVGTLFSFQETDFAIYIGSTSMLFGMLYWLDRITFDWDITTFILKQEMGEAMMLVLIMVIGFIHFKILEKFTTKSKQTS